MFPEVTSGCEATRVWPRRRKKSTSKKLQDKSAHLDFGIFSDTKIARFECLTGLVQFQLTEEISLIDFIEGESVALLIERGLFCQIGALSIPQTQEKPQKRN